MPNSKKAMKYKYKYKETQNPVLEQSNESQYYQKAPKTF